MFSDNLLKFARLPFADKVLLVEAALLLAPARLAVLLIPFRVIAPLLGCERRESSLEITPTQVITASRIGSAVVTMSCHAYWRSTCLVQAVTAQLMLKRRGIPGTLYLGTVKDGDNILLAHAWVRCGREILTGASGHERFVVVATFAPDSS